MTLRSVMLQLRDDQIEQLDAQAAGTRVSRSKLVRDAVDAALHKPTDVGVAALYDAAYATSSAGSDEWGDLDAWHDAAQRDRSRPGRDAW